MFEIAYASTSGAASSGSGMTSILMIVVMLAIFYFLLIRPENKRKKQAEEMRSSLKKGDWITTIGGVYGRVVTITDRTVVIETSEDRVRVEFLKSAIGSITVDGSLTTAPTTVPANGSVKFADNSMLMVNASKISDIQAAITGVATADISANSKLYIDNAEKDKTYKIIDGTVANWNVDNILSNNKLLKFTVDTDANTVTTTSRSVKAAYGDAVIAGDVYDAAVRAGGVAADFVAKAADEHVNADTATQVSAFNSAAALSELAGVEHGTYAASNLFTDAISEHMSLTNEKDHDSDIWAKYIHSKENIDGLAVVGADSKYDVNYNGIVVGADLYKNGKATIGAALSYVDGSVKGNTLAARTENDATYYGVSIYGGIQNEDSAVICDISYLHGKNDITQRNSGTTLTADAKSDAFSIGVRAEKSLKAGVGKFVPYAGIRYMHLGTGNYNNSIGMSYDGDDMNLWLLPVGVKYSADVKAGSWTIRPIAEIAIPPVSNQENNSSANV